MKISKLPKRASSFTQFMFWQIVAGVFVFIGVTMLLANNMAGFLFILGGFGMSVREAGLRRKWKREQKEFEDERNAATGERIRIFQDGKVIFEGTMAEARRQGLYPQ